VLRALEGGSGLDLILTSLSPNDVGLLAHSTTAPEPLRAFAATTSRPASTSRTGPPASRPP